MVDPKIINHPHGDRTFTSNLYYGADVRESLRTLPDQSVQCAVTSPPYWGLRSYLAEGSDLKGTEIGAESTPDEYVSAMVDVFREVRRVLRDDGVLWMNIGDSYAGGGGFSPNSPILLTKSQTYFYDADAVKEPLKDETLKDLERHGGERGKRERNVVGRDDGYTVARGTVGNAAGRNRRSVWTINPRPYKGAHSATMPPALAEVCVKAGSRPGDTVLDPFSGSGTTGYVANRLGRHYVGTDLNIDYLPLAEARLMGMDPPESDDEETQEGEASILDLIG